MSLTQTQLDQFHRDGYIVVPDVFSEAEMKAAQEAMDEIFYGKPFDAWLAEVDGGETASVSDGFTTTHDHKEGRSQFPTGLRALDVEIGSLDQLEQDVLDILADVPSFGERRCVSNREGNIQHSGKGLREVCLTAPCRPQ